MAYLIYRKGVSSTLSILTGAMVLEENSVLNPLATV